MNFKTKTLLDLDWHRLLEHLARRSTGEEAAKRCKELPFLREDAIRVHLELVREFMACLDGGDIPPTLPAQPTGEWLGRIRGEGSVAAEVLLDIATNLKLYASIARYLDNRRDICPRNAKKVLGNLNIQDVMGLARLGAEITSSFEPDGSISDTASPEIGRLRRQVVNLRNRLVSRIEKIAEHEEDLVRERTVTLRNDRFVIPVRADAHRRLPGIVHGASGSGATIFIEPEAVIEMGNDLMLAREAVAREEARIAAQLCEAVRDDLDNVETACRAIVDVEIRIAAARLAKDLGSSIPILTETGEMDLKGARHPLLVLDNVKVVPNTLKWTEGQSVIISGPNAGGKTVVLKTIGLLGLMISAGLPIPADPDSSMGIPKSVLTDIGDDQSLEKNLSTFSAHMTNIASILDTAKPGALVLLDELAAGTDPSEGAALAQAILERLNAIHATTFTTTHFDTLKLSAQSNEAFINAAVGFDMTEMRPTFKLRLGTPGNSSALAVARRFGAPEEVVNRAKELLPEGVRELADAVDALDREKNRAILERQSLADSRRALEETKKNYSEELRKLRQRQSKFLDDEAESLWSSIKRAREKVRDAEISLRRRRDSAKVISDARRGINNIAEALAPGGELATKTAGDLPGKQAVESDLCPGQKVYIVSLSAKGDVESPPRKGRVFVRVGNIKTQVKVKDLRILAGGNPRTPQEKKKTSKKIVSPAATSHAHGPRQIANQPQNRPDAIRTGETTVDIRGMTVDEALMATDAFLDRGLREDWPAIFILHGHGTGALRNGVRDFLGQSPYVETFRPGEKEEGGDGITVAWLR